jgi:hypothetical protein
MDRQIHFSDLGCGFSAVSGAPDFGPGYDRLHAAVQKRQLNFCVLLGMPGGVSTATLRWLAPYAHVVLNEPDGRFFLRRGEPALTAGDRALRKQKFYNDLADIFDQEYERNGGQPVTLIAKMMPHLWFNDDTMRELLALCPNPIGLMRHPGLASPSWFQKRSELLLAGIEVGQDPLSPKEKGSLQAMILERDYSGFSMDYWHLHRHLYEGDADQDTRPYHVFDQGLRPGDSMRLDRARMVVGRDRILREYTDLYVILNQTWAGRVTAVDVELLQYNPDVVFAGVFGPRWGLETQSKPARFINGYQEYPDLSQILFGPNEAWHAPGLRPPVKNPFGVEHVPRELRHVYKRAVELYVAEIQQQDVAFPVFEWKKMRGLGDVFRANCHGVSGGRSWVDRFFAPNPSGRVLAQDGAFGL